MAECYYGELYAQACENGFACLDEAAARAIRLQLLCNILNEEPEEGLNLIATSLDNFTLQGDAQDFSLSFPNLSTAQVIIIDNNALTSISLPSLSTFGQLQVTQNAALPSLSFPSLTSTIGGGVLEISSNALIPSLSFPALTALHELQANSNPSLTSISLPVLVSNTVTVVVTGNASLVSWSSPVWIMTDGLTYNFSGNALTAASVNHILARGIASGLTSGDLDLSGGTSSAPTGQGITDKADLITAGVNVTTN